MCLSEQSDNLFSAMTTLQNNHFIKSQTTFFNILFYAKTRDIFRSLTIILRWSLLRNLLTVESTLRKLLNLYLLCHQKDFKIKGVQEVYIRTISLSALTFFIKQLGPVFSPQRCLFSRFLELKVPQLLLNSATK